MLFDLGLVHFRFLSAAVRLLEWAVSPPHSAFGKVAKNLEMHSLLSDRDVKWWSQEHCDWFHPCIVIPLDTYRKERGILAGAYSGWTWYSVLDEPMMWTSWSSDFQTQIMCVMTSVLPIKLVNFSNFAGRKEEHPETDIQNINGRELFPSVPGTGMCLCN